MTLAGRSPAPRLTVLAALGLAGCVAVTINVTFPQEQLDSAASSIEDLVRNPVEAPKPSGAPSPKPSGSAAPSAGAWLGPSLAEAQVPELKTRTPEVVAVIESRRSRYPELAAAHARGCVGENNQGLVERRTATGCPANVDQLVTDENRDRIFLYRTLVQQNNMPPGDLARVQAAFAKANRERAAAGTWVQAETGEWVRK